MTARMTPEQAEAELQRRFEVARKAMTPEAVADGHEFQLKVMACLGHAILLMCSRRAGKTRVCMALLAMTAMATPGCSCLYLALTKGQAEKIWRRAWKPLLRKFKVPNNSPDSRMVTTFANGSTVVFGGTDDLRNVQHLLGDSMASGMAVIDEAQSDPGLIENLVKDVLGPMLDESTKDLTKPGTIVIAGTVPEKPEGYFYKLWTENYDDKLNRPKPNAQWKAFTWSRFENVHEKDNSYHLENYLKRYKLDANDPMVLRNWRGLRVWNDNGSLYGDLWRPEVHIVKPFPIPSGWQKFRSMFYGYSWPKLTSILWWAVDTNGNLTCYRSMSTVKRHSGQLAADIKAAEMDAGEWDVERDCSKLDGPLMASAFGDSTHSGKTTEETMADAGVFWEKADKDIASGVEQVRIRLARRSKHPTRKGVVVPGIRFFDTCWNYVRTDTGEKISAGPIVTLPTLPMDKNHPEVWDKKSSDSDAFAVSYACVYREIAAATDVIKPGEEEDDDMSDRRKRGNSGWSNGGYWT